MRLKKKDYDIMSVLMPALMVEFPFLWRTKLCNAACCFMESALENEYKRAIQSILRIANQKCKDLSECTISQINNMIQDYEYKQLLKKKKNEKV